MAATQSAVVHYQSEIKQNLNASKFQSNSKKIQKQDFWFSSLQLETN